MSKFTTKQKETLVIKNLFDGQPKLKVAWLWNKETVKHSQTISDMFFFSKPQNIFNIHQFRGMPLERKAMTTHILQK